jgi:hypothetical protein
MTTRANVPCPGTLSAIACQSAGQPPATIRCTASHAAVITASIVTFSPHATSSGASGASTFSMTKAISAGGTPPASRYPATVVASPSSAYGTSPPVAA